jgi:hypothetical protein
VVEISFVQRRLMGKVTAIVPVLFMVLVVLIVNIILCVLFTKPGLNVIKQEAKLPG